jgi:hypothetical protein
MVFRRGDDAQRRKNYGREEQAEYQYSFKIMWGYSILKRKKLLGTHFAFPSYVTIVLNIDKHLFLKTLKD